MAVLGRTLFFFLAFLVLNLTLVNGKCPWYRAFDFVCKNGDCIYDSQRCDGIKDCSEGEDEINCTTTQAWTTTEVTTESPFRKLIFEEKVSDLTLSKAVNPFTTPGPGYNGRGDTIDSSDIDDWSLEVHPTFREVNTGTTQSPRNQERERETGAQGKLTEKVPCPKNFTNAEGKCCYATYTCVDCKDVEPTRTTTPGPTETPGPLQYFKCATGELISYSLRCNRVNDCKDGSDEYKCPGISSPPPPIGNVTCGPNEVTCDDGFCVSAHVYGYCDGEPDCPDMSDEKNCNKCNTTCEPKIVELPKLKVELFCVDPSEPFHIPRETLKLECKFVGQPTPKIFWKKYEGTVPSKCTVTSRLGHGILTCPNFEPSDQGAYSCVAENAVGAAESQPKSIVVCSNPVSCSGFKVVDEQNIENCLNCYCSNKTNECHNIKSVVKPVSIPFSETKREVLVDKTGKVIFLPSDQDFFPSPELESVSEPVTYCSVHESILKQHSFVKSYGRNIKVPRYIFKANFALNAPDLIIRGDGLTLTYSFHKISHSSPTADVRFWRGNWNDLDNNPANRIQLMRVLAHLDSLLIRCEYDQEETDIWDKTDVIELESATIAEYGDSVSYLERCICPVGYSGLSCEICATDYYREEGTGICVKIVTPPPKPCNEGYKGVNCTECDIEKGYHRDQFTGDCWKKICNVLGTVGPETPRSDGTCICKSNVEGTLCDACKEGTFNLDGNNTYGCSKCWCNGVTTDCRSLDYYRSYITSNSYGGYNSSDGRHFWLLPSDFNGNRLTSYGGRLDYTIRYGPDSFPQSYSNPALSVEILSKHNVTIICTNPKSVESFSRFETSWSVPIEESYWRDRDGKILTRFEILQVLVYVKAIYIESPYHLSSGRANLTSVSLDTVNKFFDEEERLAVEVEECRCPEGYEGFSCESCALGYTRDQNDRRKCVKCNCNSNCDPETGCNECPEGSYDASNKESSELHCEPCPCNNNERSCYLDDHDQLICDCKAGFSGMKCEHVITGEIPRSQLKVTISPNKVKNRRIGTKIVFNCSYDSSEEMVIKFKKVYEDGDGYGKMDTGFELPAEDMQKINKFGSMRTLEVEIEKQLKHVECFVFNSLDMEVGRVMAVIEGTVVDVKLPVITNCYSGSHEIKEGNSLELICEATGVPTPKITWFRRDRPLIQLDSADGVHSIENATLDDSGMYSCQATNVGGTDTCTHNVVVKKKCLTLDIVPERILALEGDSFTLTCKASEPGRITWNRPIGWINNERLTVQNAKIEDSGDYTCTYTSTSGNESDNRTAEVIVERKRFGPTAIIRERDQTIETESNFEINCDVTGYPEPNVLWTYGKHLRNVYIKNNNRTLVIERAEKENEAIYQCIAHSSEGNSSGQIYITVKESSIEPRISIRPSFFLSPKVGDKVEAECVVEDGKPTPTVYWYRLDGKQLINTNVNGGKLRISEASWNQHSGRYMCVATNSAGRAQAALDIDVRFPPEVEVWPREVRENNGVKVNLECKAWGNPKPTIRWIEELKSSKRDLGLKSYDNVTSPLYQKELSIGIRARPAINRYICEAQNNVGISNAAVPFYVSEYTEEGPTGISKIAHLGSKFVIVCEGANGTIKWSKVNGSLQGDECEVPGGLKIPSVQVQHRGTYVCSYYKTEDSVLINKKITLHVVGFVNKFSNLTHSFMVLPLKPNSNDLKIDITFRPELTDGLILLEKDYQLFSLYMKNSKIFLALNFDKSPVTIEHEAPLQLYKWYTAIITITRGHADLLIYGENGKEINGLLEKSIPHNFNLSLIKEIFVGGSNLTKKRTAIPHISTLPTFEGCVSRFIQNEDEYKITEKALYSNAVKLCKRCSEIPNPCQDKGVCFDAPSQYGFVCVCPNGKVQRETSTCPHFCQGLGCDTNFNFCQILNPCRNNKDSTVHNCILLNSSIHCDCAYGYSGTTCERAKEYSFNVKGDGYVQLGSHYLNRDYLDQPEIIEIEFTTKSNDGLLLWQGDQVNHLYIGLVKGNVEYVYQNQNVQLKATSTVISNMNSKHRLRAKRLNGTVTLDFDGNLQKAVADFTTNRVYGDVYVGGMPDMFQTTRGIFTKGLTGCVNYVVMGENKPRINILERDITFHKADKYCSAQNEVDVTSEEDSDENNVL